MFVHFKKTGLMRSYLKFVSCFNIQRAKEGTIPIPLSENWAEKSSHNFGKELGKGLGLLKNECARYSCNDINT